MKLITSILLLLLIMSCGTKEAPVISVDKESLSGNQIDSILLQNNYAYGKPIAIDSTDQLLIPLVFSKVKKNRRSFKSTYSGNGSYKETWNVIFYNTKTEATNLLSEEKMRIYRIHTKPNNNEKTKKIELDRIFYEIQKIDYNSDKTINNLDPVYLFNSQKDGSSLTRISPENEDLISFQYLGSAKDLLLKTRRDTNEDQLFNDNDESVLYKATYANSKWTLKEVVPQDLKDKVDNLYFDQWLNKR